MTIILITGAPTGVYVLIGRTSASTSWAPKIYDLGAHWGQIFCDLGADIVWFGGPYSAMGAIFCELGPIFVDFLYSAIWEGHFLRFGAHILRFEGPYSTIWGPINFGVHSSAIWGLIFCALGPYSASWGHCGPFFCGSAYIRQCVGPLNSWALGHCPGCTPLSVGQCACRRLP